MTIFHFLLFFSLFQSGIGIVNAIEVAHAFSEEDGLQQFREWLESPDPTILGNLNTQSGSNLKKRGSNISSNEVEAGIDRRNSTDSIPKLKQIFMDKHVSFLFFCLLLACYE